MDFKQLEAFAAVVDYGSFSEAARRLYLTQPTISSHIRTLEKELCAKLIIRTTKKITVTAKGYQFYESAVRILHIRNHLLESFAESPKRMIDLGVSTIPSSYLLPELLAAFGKKYPDIYFHSLQSDSAGAVEKVLDGSVDLSLVGQDTGEESCRFIPFCQDRLVIAAPVSKRYLHMADRKVTFRDFLKEPIILREKGSGTKKEMDLFLERMDIPPSELNVVAQMNDLESIRKSIVNGLGISVLSARSVADLEKTNQLLVFPLDESVHMRSFYIVYSRNRILKPHVQKFIRFIQDFYKDR